MLGFGINIVNAPSLIEALISSRLIPFGILKVLVTFFSCTSIVGAISSASDDTALLQFQCAVMESDSFVGSVMNIFWFETPSGRSVLIE